MAIEHPGADLLHPEAIDHLPPYIPLPGQTDWLMWATGILLLGMIIGLGVFYFKLHHLPEQMAHKGQKIQFEIVAVLCLIALFTHNHAFWIAALLLALVPLPDLTTPLSSMAQSLGRMAGKSDADLQVEPPVDETEQPDSEEPGRPHGLDGEQGPKEA
ncbi:hypothetical protein [Stappia indica]|uniref:hypothetical protein n=1 Tax=Stappia indica TaxID=538381 RepID=UPI001CD792AC|nr:hypothetical protein [Stappia indica]MCA1300558.1 hypothetical protein [Stappia indica]